MKKVVGFSMFWMAIGILVGIWIPNHFFAIVLSIGCFLLGYFMFCGNNC